MKSILATALLVAVMGFSSKPVSTVYFFYESQAMSAEASAALSKMKGATPKEATANNNPPVQARSKVMYTSIREGKLSENEIKGLAEGWGKWVNSRCENQYGCTSVLNYYYTKEQAEKALEGMRKFYSDASKYEVNNVEF